MSVTGTSMSALNSRPVSDAECRCISGEFYKEPGRIGQPGPPWSSSIPPASTGGIDNMPNRTHGSAHPLPASPVTSGLWQDECTSPSSGSCLGQCHTSRLPGDALPNTAN
jgi:hypothetical protein